MLIGLQHKCQGANLGGARRLYMIYARDLDREFLTYELAMHYGSFSGGIPLKPGKGIVEIEAWFDSTKFDSEIKIGAGFTHALEFKHLGYEDDVVRLMAILKDYPVNVIVEGNDGLNTGSDKSTCRCFSTYRQCFPKKAPVARKSLLRLNRTG
ncbi:hypothetical protein [Dyadobacter sp. 676]|uniref:Uncharacterized protein n=1 Tax=Dyadobacter sp. 676 TaxID=3088362 RepID=A0AAU8FPW7_9BACT